MQGWHKGTHKSFKGCEGLWAHLCMSMGTGTGRGGWQHKFFSPYFSFTSTMQRDYRRVFSLDLECYLGNEYYFKWFLLLQIVPLLNERSLFITSCPSDYMKQRWANIFKQVFLFNFLHHRQIKTTYNVNYFGGKRVIFNIVITSPSVR